MLIPAQFFGDEVIHIFVEDPEVIAIGAKGLSITSFFYFFLGMIYVARSVLNGAGDALYAMINGFDWPRGLCCSAYQTAIYRDVGYLLYNRFDMGFNWYCQYASLL